jgi:S1-C subfamily serine protease
MKGDSVIGARGSGLGLGTNSGHNTALTSLNRAETMGLMIRGLLFASLVLAVQAAAPTQGVSVLHVKVVLTDAAGTATPVPRHVLLVSENPAGATPRQIVTGLDGTADIRLKPGNYTVESDRPVAFQGKAYQWTQIIDVPTGRDTVLELTAGNADAESAAAPDAASLRPGETDPSFLLGQWQDSVVALWSPTTHGSGFVIDANGLIVTSQKVVGNAASIEVQLARPVKVAAPVLAADPARDVAVLWIDPKTIASVKPVPLSCGKELQPTAAAGQEIFTIGTPMREPKRMTSGRVRRASSQSVDADLLIARGSAGGPVFTAGGDLIGITSIAGDDDRGGSGSSRVVGSGNVCEVVASARQKMNGATPPSGARLPVEPERPSPADALEAASAGRAGSLNPYPVTAATFEVAFITPVLTYGAQHLHEQMNRGAGGRAGRPPAPEPPMVRPLMDFSNWSDYVADYPPVLLVRITPKLVEGFWTTVGRMAAHTQGVSLPPIKRFKSGFGRLRAFCGENEVTPIHPFRIEQRLSETEAIYEGLYVFDPGALGPQCGSVKLTLYSEKEPEKPETKVIDAAIVQRFWDDFAGYRASDRPK